MNEELLQRGYLIDKKLKGEPFGKYELFNLGNTSIRELQLVGLLKNVPKSVSYPFKHYKPPQNPRLAKPDALLYSRDTGNLEVVANKENKRPTELNTVAKINKALEQGLYSGILTQSKVSIITDETKYLYVDVPLSISKRKIVLLKDKLSLNPGLLEDLLNPDRGVVRDPGPLAEKVWQAIWHATKQEPLPCLLTFVEIFILKFLSDNLPSSVLPSNYSFYELAAIDETSFRSKHGKTQIEYYVQNIRPEIKRIFPDKTPVTNKDILNLLGLGTIVSPTSIINGFAFLQSGATTLETFNRTFLEILGYFQDYGVLSNIDPEFKLRLYETFLKKSGRQEKLGQFFTPRNVVKSIMLMAQLEKLRAGDILLDPASGPGGFILEPLIHQRGLQNNISFKNGSPIQKIRTVGLDVDVVMHILAKANTLLHLAELVRDPAVTVDSLNRLMAEMFLLLNTNQHLGTLEYPIQGQASVIMTNPPYVTQGSRIYKEEIANTEGLRNGLSLRDYYDKCGLGLESLFIRYISGALKPGGRAFVIVPQGMLTRTEITMKEKILSECNLLASISLPRNTFFNTAQKTYIVVLERRHTEVDARPNVFCAIASSIGESLDARRLSTPLDNTLQDIAEAFIQWTKGNRIPSKISARVKIVDSSNFSSSDRWDIVSFWDDQELVDIGEREEAIDTIEFVSDIKTDIQELVTEFTTVENKLTALIKGPSISVSLNDNKYFKIRRGKRVTRKDCDYNPGPIPVYSGSKFKNRPLGCVSKSFASKNGIRVENSRKKDRPIVTINANGYVGACFVRREKCIIHDDVMVVDVVSNELDIDYVEVALKKSIAAGNFEYEAKLYNRVKELQIDVPTNNSKVIDLERQELIAKAWKQLETVTQKLGELGKWALEARLK
ncbi:MAG: N-6 DNA methylase [Bacteroidota bacterium]